jgi:hypothetical protein
LDCSFELNDKPMSAVKCGASSFPAFSGQGAHVNRKKFSCVAQSGPIPPGTYYIFDRQSGGLLGPLRDMLKDRSEWFSLYAIDNKIDDDQTLCDNIIRGSFRIHPKGTLGISEGCITLNARPDFQQLQSLLRGSAPTAVPGSTLKAYGRMTVS